MLSDELSYAKDKTMKLIRKFSTVFASELSEQLAKIDPFELELKDKRVWYQTPGNKRSARLQSISKQYATKQIKDKAIANKIIRPSPATIWSQILLTPKPNGSWRFCVDFRTLNAVTKTNGWPIPNIAQLLQRIGKQKAKREIMEVEIRFM